MDHSADSTFNTAHRVDNNVYIGGYLVASDPKFIKESGITRIVKMFADDISYPGGYHRHPGVKYLVVPADDVPSYDIGRSAFGAVKFIQNGLKSGEKILVHCHAGISRSSTIVLLHMMINRGYSLDAALARLRHLRPQVRPNDGFMEFLKATDARLKALRMKRAGGMMERKIPPPVLQSRMEIGEIATRVRHPATSRHAPRSRRLASDPMLDSDVSFGTTPYWSGGGAHAGDKDTSSAETVSFAESSSESPKWTFKG